MITYEDAKEELKSRLEEYLTSKGINTRKPFKCLAGTHADNNPSMSYDRKRNKVHCFSCNADMDIIDLIKAEYCITDTKEAFKKGYELYNIQVGQNYNKSEHYEHNAHNEHYEHKYTTPPEMKVQKDLTELFNKCNARLKETSYLQDRGISEAVANKFNIGFDANFNKNGIQEALIIPTSPYTYEARNTDKECKKENRYRKVGATQLFNTQACTTNKPVFVVEGVIDALSLIEANCEAVGLGSVNNTGKFLEFLKSLPNPLTLILCLDNDEAGQKGTAELKEGLDAIGFKYIDGNLYGDCKDANELLQKDRATLEARIKQAEEEAINLQEAEIRAEREEYKKNYASSYIKDFLDGIKERANTPFIPTGFDKLDNTLDGGLFEGLYFIGAISSLGKTTFCLQMADQIAKSGHDVLIFSLEMSRSELIAKSISRQTLLLSQNGTKDAKTTRGITTYKRYENYSKNEVSLINEAIKSYSDYAQHIVITEGTGDIGTSKIRETIEKHIRLTGRKPIVLIDYLQIIAPSNERATDKQNTDKAVTELKRISRDNKITIFAISSLNRDNYNSKISMQAFKESGAIEYSSDVLIGLQFKGQGKDFDVDEAKKKSNEPNSPREIELIILKNRNGKTGEVISYNYYPLFNYFQEQ